MTATPKTITAVTAAQPVDHHVATMIQPNAVMTALSHPHPREQWVATPSRP
jgi:hypothetical protein